MFRIFETTANRHFIVRNTVIFLLLFFILVNVDFGHSQWLALEDVSRRITERCAHGEYDCVLGDKCIPMSKFRDGINDCLDNSDEFCFPGQIKCGSICVELKYLGECLSNPTCDNSTALPSYCKYIKSKLCKLEDAVPCKGYGECVLKKWLIDGKKDCLDGSDEDPDYAKLLTSCLYPHRPTSLPDGFIEVPPNAPSIPPDLEGDEEGNPPDDHGNGRPPQLPYIPPTAVSPGQYPWNVNPTPIHPVNPTITPEDELLPINPFVRLPPTRRPKFPSEGQYTTPPSGPVNFGGHYEEYGYPTDGRITPRPVYPVPGGYNWGHMGVAEGGGVYGPPMTPIVPVTEFTQHPRYPFDNNVPTDDKASGNNQNWPVPVDNSPWIEVGGEGGPDRQTADPNAVDGQTGEVDKGPFEGGYPGHVYHTTRHPKFPGTGANTHQGQGGDSGQGNGINDGRGGEGQNGPDFETWSPFGEGDSGSGKTTEIGGKGTTRPEDGFGNTPDGGRNKPGTDYPGDSGYEHGIGSGSEYGGERPGSVPPGSENDKHGVTHSGGQNKPGTYPEDSGFGHELGSGGENQGQGHGKPTESSETDTTSNGGYLEPDGEHQGGDTSSGSGNNNHGIPYIPFVPIPPGLAPKTTIVPHQPNPKFTQPPPLSSSTHRAEEAITLPASPAASSNENRNVFVKDPYQFPLGVNQQLTTSAPGTLNCTERMKQAANEMMPNPMCECPAGQMKNNQNQCVSAEISTFRARVLHLCGVGLRDIPNEAQILTWKLATAFNYPVCVRSADDIIIFNTVCNGCEFNDLVDQYAVNNDLPEIDVKLSEVQNSACYEFVINDCDEKAECIPQGLRYACRCLPGTEDVSKGAGRLCEGVVIAHQCAKFLGVCVLFWILLLLLLAVLLPLLFYFLYRYCKKRNVNIFERFQKKKKHVGIKPKSANVTIESEKRDRELEQNDYNSGTTWDRSSIPVGRVSVPTITTTIPRPTPLNQLLPADEYCIIENDDDDASSKGDAASVATTGSTTIINKPAAVVTIADIDARRPSTGSRSATPTIWETYKILGPQYTRFSSAKRRKSSTNSLEQLLKMRQHEELHKRGTALSLPDVDVEMNAALPPLPTPKPRPTKSLSRTDSKKSLASAKSEQSAKLSEMLGVTHAPIPEESLDAAAEAAASEIVKAVEKQIPFNFGSVPSTPEIYKAAENAVTDALRNVMGPQYESRTNELQVAERLQTTTKMSPTGSRENLPVIGTKAVTSTASPPKTEQQPRPSSGTSNRSRITLPSPTIEPTASEIAANLDAVAEKLAQLPPIPVPALSKLTGKNASNTSPSTARKGKISTSPKTARSLTSEKSAKTSSDSPVSARKTISSSLKEKPAGEKKKTTRKKVDIASPLPPLPRPKASKTPVPSTSKKPRPPLPPIQAPVVQKPARSKPTSASKTSARGQTFEVSKPKLPVFNRQASSMSLKPKRGSSNPPTRQLSNISEISENVQVAASEPEINKLPLSLPSTAQPSISAYLNPKLKRVDSKGSKLPQLTDPKKASKVFCNCYESEYMLADIDIDLPGPYMLPATSIEDLKAAGVSRLPRINTTSQSAPSTQRSARLPRQSSTKSENMYKTSRLPPLDVDIDYVEQVQVDYDIDTSFNEGDERSPKQSSSFLARKIASRKAAGHDYNRQLSRNEGSEELIYEYKRTAGAPKTRSKSKDHHSHVHDNCLTDQPPWDPSPMKDGEMEQIPLDWNISRSSSLLSMGERRTQSQGDIRRITSVRVYSNRTGSNLTEKSSSLTNLFRFKAIIPDMDTSIINGLKKSLKKSNNWLDYD